MASSVCFLSPFNHLISTHFVLCDPANMIWLMFGYLLTNIPGGFVID